MDLRLLPSLLSSVAPSLALEERYVRDIVLQLISREFFQGHLP